MRQAPRFTILTILTLLIAIPGLASLVAPPPNLGSLARISRTVVFAEAGETWTEVKGTQPSTITAFRVLQNVGGEKLSGTFEVREEGGVAGDREVSVLGTPKFEKGGRYLLFLDPAGTTGRWRTKMLAYGVLREDERAGLLRPLPEAEELSVLPRPGVETIGTYRKEALLEHLSAVALGTFPWSAKSVVVEEPAMAFEAETSTPDAGTGMVGAPLHTAPAACRFRTSNVTSRPIRWFGFEDGTQTVSIYHTTPGQAGIADGGVSAVQQGAAAWTDSPNSVINLQYGGSRAASVNCADGSAFEGLNDVIFNDPCEQIVDMTASCDGVTLPGHWSSPCCGQVALFQLTSNPNVAGTHDGEQWQPATGFSIVVNDGAQCVGETDFKEVVTHFAGHALGFDHHEDSNATMYAQLGVHPSRGATLAQTDLACAQYAYHTFLDVPYNRWSWPFVEAIENAGLTAGCGAGNFCPTGNVNRAEVAVFLVRGVHGGSFVPPPATGTIFADVPADYWAAPYIEQLYNDGLTGGCASNPLRYCPTSLVTRAQMATFLIREAYGESYTPPPPTGTVFNDIPASYWAAPYVEKLFADGGTAGCSSNPPMYCPEQIVQREQVAAFLVRAFTLTLPQ